MIDVLNADIVLVIVIAEIQTCLFIWDIQWMICAIVPFPLPCPLRISVAHMLGKDLNHTYMEVEEVRGGIGAKIGTWIGGIRAVEVHLNEKGVAEEWMI